MDQTQQKTVDKYTGFYTISYPSDWKKSLSRGYSFKEWNTESNGTGTAYKASSYVTNGFSKNTNLYAQYEPATYSITIDNNGGSGGLADPNSYTFNSSQAQQSILARPTAPENKTFDRWVITTQSDTNSSISGNTLTIPADAIHDITVFAQWKDIEQQEEQEEQKEIVGRFVIGTLSTDGNLMYTDDFGESWITSTHPTVNSASRSIICCSTDKHIYNLKLSKQKYHQQSIDSGKIYTDIQTNNDNYANAVSGCYNQPFYMNSSDEVFKIGYPTKYTFGTTEVARRLLASDGTYVITATYCQNDTKTVKIHYNNTTTNEKGSSVLGYDESSYGNQYFVKYVNNKFIVSWKKGYMLTSNSATTWDSTPYNTKLERELEDICYDGKFYICCTMDDDKQVKIYYSKDLKTYSQINYGSVLYKSHKNTNSNFVSAASDENGHTIVAIPDENDNYTHIIRISSYNQSYPTVKDSKTLSSAGFVNCVKWSTHSLG